MTTPAANPQCTIAREVSRRFETPLGAMLAVASDAGLLRFEFADLTGDSASAPLTSSDIATEAHPVLDRLLAGLERYFAGDLDSLDVPLDPVGSAFEHRVWALLRQIPPGQTRSYLDIARSLGRPTATRAVARANARNPLAVIVPCHRVIGRDGTLTGYAGGLWRKDWLLRHEGARLPLVPACQAGRRSAP